MKTTKLKKYKKVRKYDIGTQSINPNIDPTTQYQNNRAKNSGSVQDMEFNNAEQSLNNRGIQQQQLQDKTNQVLGQYSNDQTKKTSVNSTVAGGLGSLGAVGKVAAVGYGLGTNTGTKYNQKSMDQALATGQGNKTDKEISTLLTPTSSKLLNAKNGADVGEAFIPIHGLFGKDSQDLAEQKAVQTQNQQKQATDQINKYGAIDNTVQAAQANKGLKKIKYNKGTSGIYIKPENKGKFNATKKATGKTTEELTHSSNPVTKKRAIFAQNASHWNHKEKGSKKLNTRIIETQGKEPVFTPKDSSGKRDLIYYNPNDPTHKEGGVKAAIIPRSGKEKVRGMLNIPQGSAIVTAQQGMNKKALDAYSKGDNRTLEKVINKMPEDNKETKKKKYTKPSKKYSDGTDSINPADKWALGKGVGGGLDGNLTSNQIGIASKQKNSSFLNNASGSLIGAAPSIYNLGRGLLEKPQLTNRRYINNEGYKYTDTSASSRRAANEAQLVNSNNIRNATGGSGGAFLANQAEVSAQRFKNILDINNQQMGERQNISNANVDLRNQQNQANLGLANQYDQLDLENKARKNQFVSAGLTGASDLSMNNQLMKNQTNADRIRANTLQTNNYKYNVQDEENQFKKEKGTKKLKGNKSLRYKKK